MGRVAAGEKLSEPRKVGSEGHAIEFRINAEDPRRNFLPQTGPVEFYNPPGGPGVRVDSHLYPGYKVTPHYDSLLAKLVVHAGSRDAAIRRGARALDEFTVAVLETTRPCTLRYSRTRSSGEAGCLPAFSPTGSFLRARGAF